MRTCIRTMVSIRMVTGDLVSLLRSYCHSSHDGDAVNIRAAMIHIIGDLVQSIGVLVAGLIIKFVSHEKAWLADPITTLIFIVIMLITTIRVVRDLVAILMNRTDAEQYDRILRVLQSNGDNVHQLHIWVSFFQSTTK